MNVYAISDLHLSFNHDKPMDVFGGHWENYTQKIKANWESKIKDDDVVLIAGDISWAMKIDEVDADLDWIDKLPGQKIIIKGNHEYWWKSISAVREILPKSIKAIQNDAIKIGSVVFCGTRGWTIPESGKELEPEDLKIYKREVERMKLTLMSANVLRQEGDKLAVMIHFPPLNSEKEENDFTKLFEEYGVDDVIFGHIHGYTNCPLHYEKNGVAYHFTSCDHIQNNPVLIYEEI
ncbi:MAG: metallophosphoesterase [Clostridia bacterium]|nr:metallophosphoesterase [Clostridia bacterium]